jgi:hypothetical protein
MTAISTPARADERRRSLGSLDDRVRLRDDALVFPDELRQHEPLRREVRRQEDTEPRDEHEQHAERERAELVQHGDRKHQRHPAEVAVEHRPARSQARHNRAAGDAQERHRKQLDGEDNAHLGRRARRREDEPR